MGHTSAARSAERRVCTVYADVAGFLTVGMWTTMGEAFPSGVTVTQAPDLLMHDVAIAERVVQRDVLWRKLCPEDNSIWKTQFH
jgi:hypothetical protein